MRSFSASPGSVRRLPPATLRSQVQFVREGSALGTGEPAAWDGGCIGGSDVVESGGMFVLLYTGSDYPYPEVFDHLTTVGIGATPPSRDPFAFENAGEPVLRWDQGGIACPSVIHDPDASDGRPWQVWYHTLPQGPESNEIRLAVSSDGVSWGPGADGPVLTVEQLWEGRLVYNPAVLFDRTTSTYRMWYDAGPDSDAGRRIGLATSTDGLTWTKCPDNPVLGPGGVTARRGRGRRMWCCDEESGVLEMWYTAYSSASSGIAYATSLDGVLWSEVRADFDRRRVA